MRVVSDADLGNGSVDVVQGGLSSVVEARGLVILASSVIFLILLLVFVLFLLL